jgi:hypothetical protein
MDGTVYQCRYFVSGPVADEAKLRAQNMAEMFNYKINYFR